MFPQQDASDGPFAQVVVDIRARSHGRSSVDRAFTYRVPENLADDVEIGSYVLVPFGRRRVPGYVVGFTDTKPPFSLKEIADTLLDEPVFNARQAELAQWICRRYMCSLSEALRLLLPPGGRQRVETTVTLTDDGREIQDAGGPKGAPRQQQVLAAIPEEGIDPDRLYSVLARQEQGLRKSSVTGALGSLADRGLIERTRSLERPPVSHASQQVARLAEPEESWDEVLERLSTRAPRQFETIEELLADDGIPVANLSRSAVGALEEKGLVTVSEEIIRRAPDIQEWTGASDSFLELTEHQQEVYEQIAGYIEAGEHTRILIHGVTGSGKTEIYLHCIREVIDRGKTAIVLVPEISLTPQMVGRFRARFGDMLALQHSALGAGERFDEWFRAKSGEARIVIGARSAVFAPLDNIGIIIIDEEYDAAYKQESTPRYEAVEVATRRAKAHDAVLVMGSATPSIERFYQAKTGEKISMALLPERIDSRPMPEVQIVDLCREPKTADDTTFSEKLLSLLNQRLADGEQSMLFLNRRGYSTFVMCRECGASPRCPHCAVSLTYHYGDRLLKCHHCGYEQPVPDTCPVCESSDIGFLGLGTERVADQIQRKFPRARILRMDRDTTTNKGAYDRILRDFGEGEADILVGTQMIATGHDFPNLTLVGVLNADTGLHRPDFRAAERTFQLITQVAGRPGRAEKPGRVLVQTYNADHYAIRAAARHDYLGFYAIELESRRENLYPPFVSLLRVVISSEDQQEGYATARRLAVAFKQAGVYDSKAGKTPAENQQLLGPAECPLHKLRGQYRFSVLLKGPDSEELAETAGRVLNSFDLPESVLVTADVDPVDMM